MPDLIENVFGRTFFHIGIIAIVFFSGQGGIFGYCSKNIWIAGA